MPCFGNNFGGADTSVVIDNFAPSIAQTPYDIDLISLVQDWSDQIFPNQGIMLMEIPNNSTVVFHSDDASNLSNRPILTVEFNASTTISEPASFVLLWIRYFRIDKKKK